MAILFRNKNEKSYQAQRLVTQQQCEMNKTKKMQLLFTIISLFCIFKLSMSWVTFTDDCCILPLLAAFKIQNLQLKSDLKILPVHMVRNPCISN